MKDQEQVSKERKKKYISSVKKIYPCIAVALFFLRSSSCFIKNNSSSSSSCVHLADNFPSILFPTQHHLEEEIQHVSEQVKNSSQKTTDQRKQDSQEAVDRLNDDLQKRGHDIYRNIRQSAVKQTTIKVTISFSLTTPQNRDQPITGELDLLNTILNRVDQFRVIAVLALLLQDHLGGLEAGLQGVELGGELGFVHRAVFVRGAGGVGVTSLIY
jgi:hypothetical protein